MTFLEFLAARPELVTTMTWWGWWLVVAVSLSIFLRGIR